MRSFLLAFVVFIYQALASALRNTQIYLKSSPKNDMLTTWYIPSAHINCYNYIILTADSCSIPIANLFEELNLMGLYGKALITEIFDSFKPICSAYQLSTSTPEDLVIDFMKVLRNLRVPLYSLALVSRFFI